MGDVGQSLMMTLIKRYAPRDREAAESIWNSKILLDATVQSEGLSNFPGPVFNASNLKPSSIHQGSDSGPPLEPEAAAIPKNSRDALHMNAQLGNVGGTREILERGQHEVNATRDGGVTALHLASMNGHVEVVRELLRGGALVNTKQHDGNTALHLASRQGHFSVIRELLEGSAEVNARLPCGCTPLHLGAMKNRVEVVIELMERGRADVYAKDMYEDTPLHMAAKAGHLHVIKELLYGGANLSAKVDHVPRGSALDPAKVRGGDVNARNSRGATPLHESALNGHLEVLKELVDRGGADMLSKQHDGHTALHLATKAGHLHIVEGLLEGGADVNAKVGHGVEGGALDPKKLHDGYTPLHIAAKYGDQKMVKMLLEWGANLPLQQGGGVTNPLLLAARAGHVEVSRELSKALLDKCLETGLRLDGLLDILTVSRIARGDSAAGLHDLPVDIFHGLVQQARREREAVREQMCEVKRMVDVIERGIELDGKADVCCDL